MNTSRPGVLGAPSGEMLPLSPKRRVFVDSGWGGLNEWNRADGWLSADIDRGKAGEMWPTLTERYLELMAVF